MTATLDTPTGTTDTAPSTAPESTGTAAHLNARGEAVFLTAETYTLTARQVVLALATHLARFGDTLAVQVVDPLCAIDAVMRFDGGDLTSWMTHRSPTDVAAIRARAEHDRPRLLRHLVPGGPLVTPDREHAIRARGRPRASRRADRAVLRRRGPDRRPRPPRARRLRQRRRHR